MTAFRRRVSLFALLCLASVSTRALAADNGAAAAGGTGQTNIADNAFGLGGLSQPGNLAGDAIGISSDNVKQINSTSGLGTSLLSGFAPDGKLKGAIGVGFSPFALGAKVDLAKYQSNVFAQWVARSTYSVAISQGQTTGSNGSLAAGFQTVLFEGGDVLLRRWWPDHLDDQPLDQDGHPIPNPANHNLPYKDYWEKLGLDRASYQQGVKYRSAVGTCNGLTAPDKPLPDAPPGQQTNGSVSQARQDAFRKCLDEARKATWNDASLGFGAVMVARAKDNSVTQLQQSNVVLYGSLTYGFDWLDSSDRLYIRKDGSFGSACDSGFHFSCNAEIVAVVKYQTEAAYQIANTPVTAKTLGFGAKLVLGTETASGYGFYVHDRADLPGGAKTINEYGAGFEVKLTKGLWFDISVARNSDKINTPATVGKATVSWDLTQAATLLNPFNH
jgi:hypothetical protein